MSQSQHESFDVAVAGGGVIGLAVAWRAAQRGARVVVVDRPREGAAWRAAAGMLAPVAEATFGERDLLRLALESAERWPAFAAELAAASGRDPGHRRCGTLVVARDRDEAEALERELAYRRELGLPVQRLRGSAARRAEPALAPDIRMALDVPGDHVADPRALRAALARALQAAGGELRKADVTGLVEEGEAVRGLELADGEAVHAERTVVAAGAWAGALAQVPVRPVKGQVVLLRDPAGPGLVERAIRMAWSYLVPRGDGRYVLGASVEERGFDTALTAGAVFELLRDAYETIPGLLELEIEEVVAGLRPGTPDNGPLLGATDRDGLFLATGHFRNGILLAPITADLVAAALAGERLPEVAAPFAAGRFELAAREVARL
jgi:glycine oxidase